MPIVGYEMHIGVTIGEDCLNPLLVVNESKAGATSPSGKVYGCYVHGLFQSDSFRAWFLKDLGSFSTLENHKNSIDETLDSLSVHLEENIDTKKFLNLTKTI